MRTCQSCGLENPPDRDFCECGEYLRWDPTGFVQAVTPEMLQQAQEQAPPAPAAPAAPAQPAAAAPPPAAAAPPPAAPAPPPAQVTPAAPPPPPEPAAGNGSSLTTGDPLGGSAPAAPPPPPPPPQPPAAVPRTAQQPAVPVPPPAPPVSTVPAEPDPAMITLRLPDRDAAKEQTLATAIEPGQRERILALVRNQSGIVDNYELRVDGLPEDWWSIYPDTVYLVPFGTGGTYEQEVEIHLHPPRTPEAEAKLWQLQVVAQSKAHDRQAAAAPFVLAIQAYTETTTKVRPERAKGRRKVEYDIAVENKANAPVLVALDGSDADGELVFGFNRPPQEIPPGATVQTGMQVRPPKQMWIGRPTERRFEVVTLTGEEAAERLAAEPMSAEQVAGQPEAPAKKRRFGRGGSSVPGVYGPKVYKPQVHAPGLSLGPGGINFRAPQVRGPQMSGPQMKGMNLDMAGLKGKMGGRGGGAPPITGPLMPSQGVFRQKPWLPWWIVPIGLLAIVAAVALYLLIPRNVVVPDVVGSESAFAAEEKLVDAQLTLAPVQKERASADAPPGSVIGQTPPAGEKAKKNAPVSLLIAVGNGKVTVPDITGMTLEEAEKALRDKKLTLGQANPAPPDPAGKIESQIPAAKEILKEGAPVDIFYPDPNGEKGGGKAGGAAPPGGGGGGGGGEAGDVVIPAIGEQDTAAYAAAAGEDGLVPEAERVFDESKAGTLFATEPPGGTKVKAGSKVKLLVSAGFPRLAFDDDKNILLVDGATGKKLEPIAKGPQREKDPAWSADGTRVAYVAGGRVFLKNMEKPDERALPLTGAGEQFSDLAWADTADLNLLAMSRLKGTDRDLCIGQINADGMVPRCIAEPGFSVGTTIRWAPNGKAILGLGLKGPGQFGIVRWRSKQAFSPDPKDWGKGRFESDMAEINKGAIDAAISPDGKQMAIVSNAESDFFRLYLGKPNDFLLTSAKPTTLRACKVAWRGDSRELVVMQADEGCREAVGSLVRLDARDPTKQTELNASGDNMVFQPTTPGG